MKTKVVVLDFDNFLILDAKTRRGSEDVKDETFITIFAEYDRDVVIPLLKEAKTVFKGGKGDRVDVIRYILEHLETQKDQIVPTTEIKCNFFTFILQQAVVKIGVSEEDRTVLAELKKRVPLYLNTGTPHVDILESLSRLQLASFFTGVYARPYTKLENLQKIVRRESIRPDQLLFGDDLPGGWEAAQEIGCQFVGMHTAAITEWHDGKQPFPVIQSIREILTML